jgi:hypothetical protein
MKKRRRGALRYSVVVSAAVLASAACGGQAGNPADTGPTEEEQARAAAEEVAKNCHNPDAPNEKCATVEELSRLSPGRWRTRVRLFNGRDVCVAIDLSRFERVGDNLRGVDRIGC